MKMKSVLLSLIGALALTGCSNLSSDAVTGNTGVTISGSIGATSLISARDLKALGENGTMNAVLGDLEIYVIYFSGTKVGIVQAAVDATSGAWSFQIPPGAQVNAIVRSKTSLELLGPITFVDTNEKDMSGKDKESSTFSFKSGASIGSILLSTDGKFKVDANLPAVAAAANTVVVVPLTVLDFTGSWNLQGFTETLPAGYGTACAVGDLSCRGPSVGEPIYIAKLPGKKFSYSGGTCAARLADGVSACGVGQGTVSTTDLHAAEIWAGGASIEACGFKTGFAADDARAYGRISIAPADLPTISGTGIVAPQAMTFGRVSFTIPTGYGTTVGGDPGPNSLPWMKGGATTTWDIMECANVERTGADSKVYELNVCKGTLSNAAVGYQAMGPGGCVDASNKPVIITDWPALNGSPKTCSSSPHPGLANMTVSTCSYTGILSTVASASAFVCTNTMGVFTDSAATSAAANGVYMQTFSKVLAGALCRNVLDGLQRYKCYANAYFKDSSNRTNTGCRTEWRFNWNATSTADFVSQDGSRDKPKQQHLTGIVTYSPDGQSMTVEDEQNESVSIQNGTGSIVCRVSRKTTMKATSISASKMLVDLTQSAFLRDTNVAACVGEKNNTTADMSRGSELYRRLQEGNGKFLFYLVK